MSWQPIVLFGMAGILAGGVMSTWKEARVLSLILAAVVAACLVGGVLWLVG